MGMDFEDQEIIVGRRLNKVKKYGSKATGYIGKVMVSSGEEPVLGKKVLMDLSRSHVAIVCGKRGGGKCVTENTEIFLEDGSKKTIKELKNYTKKVLSINNNYKIEKSKQLKFYSRKVQKILKIKLNSGKEIEVTPEHPLLTIKGWINAKNLKKESRIATPRKLNFGTKKLSQDKIKIIAYLLAEGCIKDSYVLFTNQDETIINDFKKSIKNFDKNLDIKKNNHTFRVVAKNSKRKILKDVRDNNKFKKGIIFDKKTSIVKFLENLNIYNKYSYQKEVPDIIYQLNKKNLSLFLNRMFSCDGSIYFEKTRTRITYSSSSKKLIKDMQNLLTKFSILSRIKTKKTKRLDHYELEINPSDHYKFIKEINFFSKKRKKTQKIKLKKNNTNIDTIPKEIWDIYRPKNWSEIGEKFNYKYPKSLRSSINYAPSIEKLKKIAEFDKRKDIQKIAESDIFWDKIIDIKEIKGDFKVYDLEIQKNHNFIANNIIIHNSYTMSVLIEEFDKQPFEVKERLSAIIIDTVGIFWTMKYENKEAKDLLKEWNLEPKGIDIRNMIPEGKKEFYENKGIPFDRPFSIKTSQMDIEDFLGVFRLSWRDPESSLLSRTIESIRKKVGTMYDIDDIITVARKDDDSSKEIKDSLINRLRVAKSWGLFSKKGTTTKEFARAGAITVVDVSTYKQSIGMESIQELIVGLLGKRLFEERMLYRKEEEKNLVEGKKKESEMPIVWMMIDEAHMFMPQDRPSMALDVLLQWIRVGRQPGLSLLLATQRPNKLHSEAISQCDFFLSMRMTAQDDIEAVSAIRPSYLKIPMSKFYAQMPRSQGYAILVDDNSEKVIMLKIRPRLTWDGGKTANVFSD